MTKPTTQRAEVWRQYWSRGSAHSCGGSFADGYGNSASEFWNSVFTSLPTNGCVLDIGTGNGPLPRLLIGLESRPDLRCDAIDLADIAPSWPASCSESQRSRVRFHGNCSAEQLPFPDQLFSAVISQWGFEYSNLKDSIPEALRVLAPGGSVSLILHHVDALPVVLGQEELHHLGWLMSPGSFLSALYDLLEPMSRSGSAEGRASLMRDNTANALRAHFHTLQDAMRSRITVSRCPDVLQDAMQVAAELLAHVSQQGILQARQSLALFEEELRHAQLRLKELCTHALDATAIDKLGRALGRGAPHEIGLLKEQGQIMGWTLRVTPSNKPNA